MHKEGGGGGNCLKWFFFLPFNISTTTKKWLKKWYKNCFFFIFSIKKLINNQIMFHAGEINHRAENVGIWWPWKWETAYSEKFRRRWRPWRQCKWDEPFPCLSLPPPGALFRFPTGIQCGNGWNGARSIRPDTNRRPDGGWDRCESPGRFRRR